MRQIDLGWNLWIIFWYIRSNITFNWY